MKKLKESGQDLGRLVRFGFDIAAFIPTAYYLVIFQGPYLVTQWEISS